MNDTEQRIYDYLNNNSTVTQAELPDILHIGKSTVRKFIDLHGTEVVDGISVIDFFERNKKNKKTNELKEYYKDTFILVKNYYEEHLDSTYTDIANALGIGRKTVSNIFNLFGDEVLNNGNTLNQQFNMSNVLREKLCDEIFNYFNNNPTCSFSEIEKALNVEVKGKVRKLLIEMGDRVLSNGKTVWEQLEINSNTKSEAVENKENKVIEYFKLHPNLTPTQLSNVTVVDRSTVILFLNRHENDLLDNGVTIKEQREINRNNDMQYFADRKEKVIEYFINNPTSNYNDISNKLGIDRTSVKRYLKDEGYRVVPSTGLTIDMQIQHNNNEYNTKGGQILRYFSINPETQFKDLARLYNCSQTFVSRLLHNNEDYELNNGRTVKEQLLINNHYIDEDKIVEYFKHNIEASLHEIANALDIDLDTVRVYLYQHVEERLDNGLTIGEQLNKNNHEIWHRNEDIIPDSGVFIRNSDGSYRGLIIELDGIEINLKDKDGIKIGTINVSSDFEDTLVRESISYILRPGISMADFSFSVGKDHSTISHHFSRIKDICPKLYELIKNNMNLSKKSMKGEPNWYSQEEIDKMCLFMIKNNFDFYDASVYYNITPETLEFIMKRASIDLRIELGRIIHDKMYGTGISFK